jgi:hypothetical protein
MILSPDRRYLLVIVENVCRVVAACAVMVLTTSTRPAVLAVVIGA